jgi:hypothetical protein
MWLFFKILLIFRYNSYENDASLEIISNLSILSFNSISFICIPVINDVMLPIKKDYITTPNIIHNIPNNLSLSDFKDISP